MPSPSSPGQTLEDMMKLALAGDRDAYSRVLQSIKAELGGYLGRKVPPKDREDVMQEILLSVHKARHTYDAQRPLMPWVMAIARFRLMDYWRQRYSPSGRETADIDDFKNILSEDRSQNMETHEDIRKVLDSLPPKQQQIIDLMYRQDKGVQEVADMLNISVSAVKVTAHRTYKIFRKRLME